MAPLEFEGRSLGEKHRNYNKLVKKAIARNTPIEAGDLNSGEYDVEHLMKIDIASHKRDVEYILNVLKCDDMLYVSRAIKQSTWLITDQQYAHIVNPTYLNAHLFPQMTASAQTKFMKHVRHHLKDTARAEQFFNQDIVTKPNVAVKWLPNCSEEFIICNARKYLIKSRNARLFKRICEKTPRILEILMEDSSKFKEEKLEAANFLLEIDLEAYLTVVEKQNEYDFPRFGVRTTNLLMKKCPKRIIDNFVKYSSHLHLPTFIAYLKPNDIKGFLFTQVMKKDLNEFFRKPENVQYFINAMRKEQRSEFVDQIFIKKIHTQEGNKDSEKVVMKKFYDIVTSYTSEYMFYDFNTAFDKITKDIRSETSQANKTKKLYWLIHFARSDWINIQTVLNYYHEKHINDPLEAKEKFMKQLLPKINVSKLTLESWNKLENLFKQMNVLKPDQNKIKRVSKDADTDEDSTSDSSFDATEEPDQNIIYRVGKIAETDEDSTSDSSFDATDDSGCIEMIVLHRVIKGEKIPAAIEKKFFSKCLKFLESVQKNKIIRRTLNMHIKNKKCNNHFQLGSLKLAHNSLNNQDKEKVFKYLYDNITDKINNMTVNNEAAFKEGVCLLAFTLTLLYDRRKQLSDFPWILRKIKEFLKIKYDNAYNTNMTRIYDANKYAKRDMFDISIGLCPSQIVCLNALKHNVELLSLERNEVNALRCNEKVSLRRLMNKLRVYWPRSLTAKWTQRYMQELTQPQGHRAAVRGLCTLLPRQQLLQLVQNYAPEQPKIDFQESDETTLNVQKQLAKNMHFARPRPNPDAILLYAKGDYLQFALPSLLAIFTNANAEQTRNFITTLLSGPVSIQKHGIRLAFIKLEPEESLPVFRDIWMNIKNYTIRAVIFQYTFSFLSKSKNMDNNIWELLFFFIENLTLKEDKNIYKLISDISTLDKVPDNMKGEFLKIVYNFLTVLIPTLSNPDHDNYQWRVDKLIERSIEYMELVPSDFISDCLSKFMENKFLKKRISFRHGSKCSTTKVISAFLLCTKADKSQIERYNMFLVPFLKRCISCWDQMQGNEYFIRCNVDELLSHLRYGLKLYVLRRRMDYPLNIFEDIGRTLNQIPLPENYILLTKWKLTVELTRILQIQELNSSWDEICKSVAPEFGKKCLEFLKSDVATYFPCIYVLFSQALSNMLDVMPDDAKFIIYENLLTDVQFVQAYLAVMKMYPSYYDEKDLGEVANNIRTVIGEHTSVEVKMHYNHKFAVKA